MTKTVPTMCINCSTICGLLAIVEDGKVIKIEGNKNDPNSRGRLCAKGHAALNMLYDPFRILHPLKRIGKRGEGKWEKISWQEAIELVVEHLKPLREKGKQEQFILQYGRDCTNGLLDRFTNAFGTPNKVGHRGLCSLNKRVAIKAMIGDTDWDTNDVEHTTYMLNFGSNFYEAHQGHVPLLQRAVKGRKKNKAKLVTFDVRLSNTAARSDEWIPIFPGTDGLVALTMGNILMQENLYDQDFIDNWTNFPSVKLKEYLSQFTVEWAEKESGVPAATIQRLAIEFGKAAPYCTTISNRGVHAHQNGFYNEAAIVLLNAIVGNIGKKGGWCYIAGKPDKTIVPEPSPVPKVVEKKTELTHPSDFPIANHFYPKAVSSTIYPYIESGRITVSALMTYYVNPPMSWPEGPTKVEAVYQDEEKIPFHVAIDAFYSESAHLADVILPDATFLEKWDIDSRNSYELIPYIGLRQPVVAAPGEAKDIRMILKEIAVEIGGGMEQFFQYETAEQYIKEWTKQLPISFSRLKREGFYWDSTALRNYEPFKEKLLPMELTDTSIDDQMRVVRQKDGKLVGIVVNGVAYRGFETNSRKLEIFQPMIAEKMNASPLPTYVENGNNKLAEDECILTTFKWNVHTQSRTMNQKWLAELVHDNPVWINPATASKLAINDGDFIELESETGKLVVNVHLTEGIHPKVVAISASMGHRKYGPIASNTYKDSYVEMNMIDHDIEANKWWQSNGYNPNPLISQKADPIGGGQAWNDTIVKIKKIKGPTAYV